MRLTVLTTETLHHAYFLHELGKRFDISAVVIETRTAKPVFEISHPFESAREDFERDICFAGRGIRISDFAETFYVESVNDRKTVALLNRMSPDVIVVFGTGIVRPPVIQAAPGRILNLHGGDPEYYRGLDSHLWAIYHQDFAALVTSLHHVNAELDDGDIILQSPIKIPHGAGLHELRYHNTNVCIELTIAALSMYADLGNFLSRPQRKRGRYYSYMPACLKDICVEKFERYAGERR